MSRPAIPHVTIRSGGQTGVDRAALDAARALGLARGGWCPAGRWAEDGPLPPHYPLRETPSADPAERTRWNVRDADATLILTRGTLSGGTALTADIARELGKPLLVTDLTVPLPLHAVRNWLAAQEVRDLNVAGPRESEAPGIYAAAMAWLSVLMGG
jgi:hypothetical protein